jgi:hypothetical protein
MQGDKRDGTFHKDWGVNTLRTAIPIGIDLTAFGWQVQIAGAC